MTTSYGPGEVAQLDQDYAGLLELVNELHDAIITVSRTEPHHPMEMVFSLADYLKLRFDKAVLCCDQHRCEHAYRFAALVLVVDARRAQP